MEWWFDNSGQNLLKGVVGDVNNHIRLADEAIVDFLMEIQDARDSFNRLVPTMLPAEQDRLKALIAGAPTLAPLIHDRVSDNFQHRMNTMSIRTSGPRGGGSWAPPPFKG